MYCVHVVLSGSWKSNPHFSWVTPVFNKLYVKNHIASTLQIITYPGILTGVGTKKSHDLLFEHLRIYSRKEIRSEDISSDESETSPNLEKYDVGFIT